MIAEHRTDTVRQQRRIRNDRNSHIRTRRVPLCPRTFPYSGGVAAEDGFAIERVRFQTPVPLEEGFARIEAYLDGIGRPYTSFAACELRSPEPFSEQGFVDFNRVYVGTLERWGIFKDDENPVARSNVCPEINGPPGPSFHAFSYTVPAGAVAAPSFVIAGSAESPEGGATYEERIIRLGETSEDAILEKAQYVIGAMETRMTALGVGWSQSPPSPMPIPSMICIRSSATNWYRAGPRRQV